MITIVMASYLGYYDTAAKNREQKIIRAIKSVQEQTYTDWELLIIGDSCPHTKDIVIDYCNDKIKYYNLKYKRDGLFQPYPRNTGIKIAKGEWICYLDIDDIFGKDHLLNISKGLTDNVDWVWFDDYCWNGSVDNDVYNDDNWNLQKRALEWTMCGTSNIAHKKNPNIYWIGNGYKHDWHFILKLKKEFPNYKYISGGEYKICHMPGRGGYDV